MYLKKKEKEKKAVLLFSIPFLVWVQLQSVRKCACNRLQWPWQSAFYRDSFREGVVSYPLHKFYLCVKKVKVLLISHLTMWKLGAIFLQWQYTFNGVGRRKKRKLLFVLTRSLLQSSLTQSTVRLTDYPEPALTGNVKFKRAGEGTEGSLEGLLCWLRRSVLWQEGQSSMKQEAVSEKMIPLSCAGFWSSFSILSPQAHKEARLCDDRHYTGLGRQHRS